MAGFFLHNVSPFRKTSSSPTRLKLVGLLQAGKNENKRELKSKDSGIREAGKKADLRRIWSFEKKHDRGGENGELFI